MKILLSLVWLALAAAFVWNGRELAAGAERSLPQLETAESPRVEIAGEGFHLELDVQGTPLNQPFEKLRADVEAWVERVRAEERRRARRGALLCYAGAGTCALALALTWAGGRARGGP